MATPTNWLSFSVSPMEMLRSSEAQFMSYDIHHANNNSPHYLIDNFFPNGWTNNPNQISTKEESHHHQQQQQQTINMAQLDSSNSIFTTYIDPNQTQIQNQNHHNNPVPKLEDFFSDSSPIIRYSDSQTESSLTQIYDQQNSAYNNFNEHHHHQAIAAFQGTFSTNSGASEVNDDSASIARNQQQQLTEFGQIESGAGTTELGFSRCDTTAAGALSLGVNQSRRGDDNNNYKSSTAATANNHNNTKAIVVSENSDCSKKIADTFGQRTSIYRGVTRHRWTGRYEAHLWDNSCRREGQARKGRQVYLGGYDKEDKAARAYDLAALKYWGPTATTNFPITNYSKEVEEMKHVTKQEFIASLRRKSSGFSRGASIYRGVTRHHQQGRWQARIGRVAGNKDLYLGTFATEEEAAEAYDIAAIKFRGLNAVTNFEMNRYDVEAIMQSALPIGGAAKRLKISLESEQKPTLSNDHQRPQSSSNGNISFSQIQPPANSTIPCGIPFDAAAYYHHNLIHHLQQTSNMGTTADSTDSTSSMTTSMNMLQQPTEFFLWPHHHQSY